MAGLYGKLPSHGDFLRRRISDEFLARWDSWLQRGVHESRAALGDAWDDIYAAAPAWRFVMPFGKGLVAGVVLSSGDRVGRLFPLTIAVELHDPASALALAAGDQQWFDAIEHLALAQIAPGAEGLSGLDAGLALIPDLSAPIDNFDLVAWPPAEGVAFQVPKLAHTSLSTWLAALLDSELAHAESSHGVWWTSGCGATDAQFEAEFWIVRGWPDSGLYTRMISLPRIAGQPAPMPSPVQAPEREWTLREDPDIEDPDRTDVSYTISFEMVSEQRGAKVVSSPCGISAAVTHEGKVRAENQDAFLDLADDRVWVVADGLGGLKHGAQASAAVVAAFDAIPRGLTLTAWAHAAHAALTEVNATLNSVAEGDSTASTVVAAAVRGAEAAVLWVGDSRLYRYRSGRFEQMTRDHSAAAELADEGSGDFADLLSPSSELARAVGAEAEVEIDFLRIDIEVGDRYLLCSDGVYGELSNTSLAAIVSSAASASEGVATLADAIFKGHAHDNLTGILVFIETIDVANA